jgi:hypothetical protein
LVTYWRIRGEKTSYIPSQKKNIPEKNETYPGRNSIKCEYAIIDFIGIEAPNR